MRFSELVGQAKLKSQLLEKCKQHRLSHAQLFVGKEGVGKMAFALAMSQYLNCDAPTETDSCGTCPSCVKHQKFIHPDLHFVFPIIKSGAKTPVCDDFIEQWRAFLLESPYVSLSAWYKHIGVDNKQGVIYAEESAEIIRKLSRKSYEGKYKIVIIWQPEKMHLSCANKLLKILEEPPQKTLFFLLTENSEEILPTIYSRTQLLRVPEIDEGKLVEHLQTSLDNAEEVKGVAILARGSLTEAKRLLNEQASLQFHFEEFKSLMRLTYQRKVTELYDWAEGMAKVGREKQKQFLDYACRMTRENFMYNLEDEDLYRITPDEAVFSSKFAPFINFRNVQGLFEDFTQAYADISANGNAKIIFMDLGLQITRKIRLK